MEMDAASCSSSVLARSITTDHLAQPTILGKVKKEMMSEARAAESKKRAVRQVVARHREKEKKLAEERAKQAKLL
jgi:hypothetical protein